MQLLQPIASRDSPPPSTTLEEPPRQEEPAKPALSIAINVIRPDLGPVTITSATLGTKSWLEPPIVPPASVAAQPAAPQTSLFAPVAPPASLDRLESALLVILLVQHARQLLPPHV